MCPGGAYFQDNVFFGLSTRERKTCKANSARFLVATPTCQLPYLARRNSKT